MAGLAASIDLARQGLRVSLLESASEVGGKVHQTELDGRFIDSGPTVLTMRWVFDDLMHDAGLTLDDFVHLSPLKVLGRHVWSDQRCLDLFTDPQANMDAIAEFAGPREARRFKAFCEEARALYHRLEPIYMRGPRPNLASMSCDLGLSGLALLSRLGPLQSLWRSLGRHFEDPALRQLFARYATYCGGSPWEAPATLMLIAYVEMRGVWAAEGGMSGLAKALASAAEHLGAQIRCNAHVHELIAQDGRIRGVTLLSGERIEADHVIFNGEAAALSGGLLGVGVQQATQPSQSSPRSLSALTFALLGRCEGRPLHIHNIYFQGDYESEFRDVFHHGRLPRSPTVYICAQDRSTDRQAGPPSASPERLFLLVNAPARGDESDFSDKEIERCQQTILSQLQSSGLHINPQSPVRVATPAHFHRRFAGSGGALYGRAPHGWMSIFQRPSSRSPVPGLYLAGGSAHPGAGVPMATLSGRLAAATLMADRDSTSRSHRVVISGGMSTRSATTATMD